MQQVKFIGSMSCLDNINTNSFATNSLWFAKSIHTIPQKWGDQVPKINGTTNLFLSERGTDLQVLN